MNRIPLSAEAIQLRDQILSIPFTYDAVNDDLPVDADPEDLIEMHDIAMAHPQRAVPLLKKRVKDFPDAKPYWNYLYISYSQLGQKRQASATLKELMRRHPNYLFGRVSLSEDALMNGRLEQAASLLGPELDIRSLYPERKTFHVSEMFNYYLMVARILARRGDVPLAIGVKEAVETIKPSPEASQFLENEIMMASVASLSKKLEQRNQNKISVKIPPVNTAEIVARPPDFHHPSIDRLYDAGWLLEEEDIEEILSLPRETMVEDLIAVIRDCTVRGPLFLKKSGKNRQQNAVFHAIHLLAEVDVACDVPDILAFFSLHPDVLDICYIKEIICSRQIARLIQHDLAACFVWLRTPAVHYHGKCEIITAIERIAKTQSSKLAYIKAEFGALLDFLLHSPREDNILDTELVCSLILSITLLRASEHLPLIRKAYEVNLADDFFNGLLKDVERVILKPMEPASPWLNIHDQYDAYEAMEEEGDDDEDDYSEEEVDEEEEEFVDPLDRIVPFPSRTGPNYLLSSLLPPKTPVKPSFSPPESRNAPCPCGSGKKYKKCCAPA